MAGWKECVSDVHSFSALALLLSQDPCDLRERRKVHYNSGDKKHLSRIITATTTIWMYLFKRVCIIRVVTMEKGSLWWHTFQVAFIWPDVEFALRSSVCIVWIFTFCLTDAEKSSGPRGRHSAFQSYKRVHQHCRIRWAVTSGHCSKQKQTSTSARTSELWWKQVKMKGTDFTFK